jgi:hypothetical protein
MTKQDTLKNQRLLKLRYTQELSVVQLHVNNTKDYHTDLVM